MKYTFICAQQPYYPITVLCRVMRVGTSAYYDWRKRPARLIDSATWQLCIRMKTLFAESRQSLGNRQMVARLRKEGFVVGRYKVRLLMKKLGLVVKNKQRYVVTTESKHKLPVADNQLNRNFSPGQPNRVWTTDITYIRTAQGWIYLAVVLDLYSRRVVGWHMEHCMTVTLVNRALMMAINLRKPPGGLLHHSDRGSQYASQVYQTLMMQHNMQCSMSRKGNCWDNAPTERFFSSLKREWLAGILYKTRESAIQDILNYIAYYNSHRLHTTLGNMTPLQFEKSA